MAYGAVITILGEVNVKELNRVETRHVGSLFNTCVYLGTSTGMTLDDSSV